MSTLAQAMASAASISVSRTVGRSQISTPGREQQRKRVLQPAGQEQQRGKFDNVHRQQPAIGFGASR